MVARVSQAVDFGGNSNAQVRQSSTGYASPDRDKFAENAIYDAPRTESSTTSRLLGHLFGTGAKLAEQKFKQGTEEAYLSGVAKAGVIESEANLDADPLMRDWETAGYRDTMGRVAAAENEAKITADMQQMREKSPAQFGEYLAEQRSKLAETWGGMSLPVRQTMFAQQLMNERSAIKRHGVEHYKFGQEVEAKAIKANVDTSFASLKAAKGHLDTYKAATDAAWATIYSAVGTNPKLQANTRGGFIADIVKNAYENDDQMLADQILNRTGQMLDGTTAPLSALMSRDEQIAVSKVKRTSEERTAGIRALAFHEDKAIRQADWDNPDTPLEPYADVKAWVDDAHARGYFGDGLDSATKAATIIGDYARSALKKEKSSGLAHAFVTGNVDFVNGKNATRSDSVEAWRKAVGSKLPVEQAVGTMLNQAATHGWPEATKAAGDLMVPAFAQLQTMDEINPSNAAMVAGVLGRITAAEVAGKGGMMQSFLTAFSPDMQEFVLDLQGHTKAGNSPEAAVAKSRAAMLERTKAGSTGLNQAVRSQNDKDNAAILQRITPVGMFGNAWGAVKSIFSSDAEKRRAIQVKADYWENPARVAENESIVKYALAGELSAISRERPMMPADSREQLALARVQQRTVMSPWGPVVVQQGMSIESTFGVKDPERAGAALAAIVKPAEGNRVSFLFDNGRLVVTERNSKDGLPRAYTIDPRTVAAKAEEQRKAEEVQYRKLAGDGFVKGLVKYDGQNTQGVDMQQMADFRERLLEHEGYSDKEKPDVGGSINKRTGKPVKTVGPGLSDTGNFYPKVDAQGKITPQQASEGLRDASDEAARFGLSWQTSTRTKDNPAAFQLFAEMAYQGGGYNKAMNPLLLAVRERDPVKAKAALEATPAYKMAHKERKDFYAQTLTKLMR